MGTADAAAFPPVVTNSYTITGAATSVSDVSAVVSSTAAGAANTSYTVRFMTPSSLPAGDEILLTCTTCAITLSSTTLSVSDLTPGNSFGAQTESPSGSGSDTLTIPISTSGIAAGDMVQISFSGTNPPAGTYTYGVSTTLSTVAVQSGSITFAAPSSSPSVSTSSQAIGAGDTFTFGNIIPNQFDTPTNTEVLTATAGVTWSSSPFSYTITDNTTSTGETVTSATSTTTGDGVTLTTANSLTPGHTFTITANGTNPSTSQSVSFGIMVDGQVFPSTAAVMFGAGVSNVTVAPTPATAGITATWAVGFTSTDGLGSGGTITIVAPKGTTFSSSANAVVTDTTTGVSRVATVSASTTNTTNDTLTLTLPSGFSIASGNTVTAMLYSVTNPAFGSYSGSTGVTVDTSSDPVPAYAVTVVFVPAVASNVIAPTVTVNPATPGSLATYSIATFKAASELVAGTDTIEVVSPSNNTVFPGSGYTLSDATTSTGTQTLTVRSGGSSNDVILNLASNVAAGDVLSLSISNVINPSGGTYTIDLGADIVVTNTTVAGTQGLTGQGVAFPGAATSFPNGAIVDFAGTDYVFAGGMAFPATTSELAAVQAVDHATVITAATGATVPTTATPAAGTMIKPVGGATIYVVGTNGQLFGFASPSQMESLGYDPAFNVTVPSLGTLTVALSTAGASEVTALLTSATGAIINTSPTFYVFAGGHAIGIPGPVYLATVRKNDPATVLNGSLSAAQLAAPIADGTLLTIGGIVYVSSGQKLYSFVSQAELAADGFGGTASLTVQNSDSLLIVARPYATK